MNRQLMVVYTAIAGGFRDQLRPPAVIEDPSGRAIRFICFSDAIRKGPAPWEIQDLKWVHANPRRSARYHKINAHKVLPPANCSLWIDGSEQLLVNPWELADKHLNTKGGNQTTLAVFKHPNRTTVVQEVQACVSLKKDDPTLMRKQLDRYRKEGFPDNIGLFETAMVMRQHGSRIWSLCDVWWREIYQGSFRDQISLPYALWRVPTPLTLMPGRGAHNPYSKHTPHK